MSEEQKNLLHYRIEVIISRSRAHEESFLVDAKSAAKKIVELFDTEGVQVKEASVFEVVAA